VKFRLFLVVAVGAAVAASPAVGSRTAARWFFTPGKVVHCELGLNRHGLHPPTYVFCLAYRGGRPYRTARAVTMNTAGALTVCHGLKCIGNSPVSTVMLKAGHSIVVGPFRCTSLRPGVRCVVTKLGRGFRLSARGLRRI
jgi:hypothetical protein